MNKNRNSWSTDKFGVLFTTLNAKSKQVKSSEYKKTGKFPIIDQGENFICGYSDKQNNVVNKDLPIIVFGDHTRIVKFIDFPFIAGADGTQLLKPNKQLKDKYLFYSTLFISEKIGNHGYDRHLKHLKEYPWNYPNDLKEQEKIASILSSIDLAIEKTKQLIAKYKNIKNGLMQNFFQYGIDENGEIRSEKTHKFKDSSLGRIPEEWNIMQLYKISEYIGRGRSPQYATHNNKYPIINQACVYWDRFAIENLKYCDPRFFLSLNEKLILKKGDLLINSTGTGTLGRVLYFEKDFLATIDSHITLIRVNTNCIGKYFYYQFATSNFQNILSIYCVTGSTNQIELSREALKSLPIIVPPKPEQEKIAIILSTIDLTIEKETVNQNKLFSIKQGLMQDLLTGKVRVNHLLN